MLPSLHSGPERFKVTMAAGLKEVETRVNLRRADLDKAWADLDNHSKGVQQRTSAMGIVGKAPLDEAVEMNVRGSLVNFNRWPAGVKSLHTLANLFDSVWDERLPRDSDGRIVLDESPVCVKHLLHKILERPGAVTASSTMCNAFPADEEPHLPCVARTLGLSPVRTYNAGGMLVTGGTTILKPDEVSPLTEEIQDWCPDNPQELKLLYRASRDGFDLESFRARCGSTAPTISLFRVMTEPTGRSYSVIGGFSKVGFARPQPAEVRGGQPSSVPSPGAFVFMLKDGTHVDDTPSGAFYPQKWSYTKRGNRPEQKIERACALNYGPNALRLLDWDGKIMTSSNPFEIHDGRAFLALSDRRATEIEVFEVVQEATVSPAPAAKRARPSDEVVLIDDTVMDAPRAMTAQQVSDDLHHFGALVASPLMEEQTALFRAQSRLVLASRKAAASLKALIAIFGPEVAAGRKDEVVELSVRGIRMTTLRSTLQACPESALAARFDSKKWAPTDKDLDESGRQVVDCRPSCFSKLLDVLRLRKRAEWTGEDWKKGWGGSTRVGIKAADRGEFEQFVHIHFPGCERFIMDCVETREESMACW